MLWNRPVFDRFEETTRLIPEEWFDFGATAALADQFALGQGERGARSPAGLIDWVQRIRGLCELPRIAESRSLRSPFDRGLTPKKRHEVEAVVRFLQDEGVAPSRILDIGGGAGHLARHLVLGLGCAVESIDRDRTLQEKGRRLLRKYPWRDVLQAPLSFIPGEFPGVSGSGLPGAGAWAIGLHTCGELAWSQLELAGRGYSVLNVGCCYEKLNVASDTQRSRFVRERPLPLTDESLFLANRGGVERSLEEFVFQQRVLRYRYTLYELLCHEGRGDLSEAVGSAHAEAYRGTFGDYARDRVRELEFSDAAFEDFYRSREVLVDRRRFVAFLRNLLARPVEIALLLDRALFVQENAEEHGVRLVQLFDARISPRNVGVVVSPCAG